MLESNSKRRSLLRKISILRNHLYSDFPPLSSAKSFPADDLYYAEEIL